MNEKPLPPRTKRRGKKGGKFKKNSAIAKLAEEEVDTSVNYAYPHFPQVDFLSNNTSYDGVEIVEWYNAFLEDNPEGTLSKVKHTNCYLVKCLNFS